MKKKVMWTGMTLGAVAALGACSHETSPDSNVGTLDLALQIEGDYVVDSVQLAIDSEELGVSRNRTLNVSDPNTSLTATEGGLPEGEYSVKLSASLVDDPDTDLDESEIDCAGSVDGVDVVAGETADANLVMTCTVDGGQVQVAGGLRINAETEVETINTCPDLIGSAFVGSLDTSTGASVELFAEVAEGAGDVSVEWSSSAGTISDDGSAFTCPELAGVYTVVAEFDRADGCAQTFSEQVTCHNDFDGDVADLPDAFALEGCGLSGPCMVEQDGKSFQAVCGNRPDRLQVYTGEANGENSFPFYGPSGASCAASVVDGEFVGTCTDDGVACAFVGDTDPAPSPMCPVIESIDNLTNCSGSYDSCEVFQQGCNVIAKCGDDYFGRDVDSERLRMQERLGDKNIYCEEPGFDGTVTGECVESGRGLTDPLTCDYSADITLAESACEETLPSEGFILEGCGLDDTCFAFQSGCAWEVRCGGATYDGVATATDAFEFVGPGGDDCSASVVDGKWTGTCGNGDAACTFGAVDPVVDSSCFDMPEVVWTRGCGFGSPTAFHVVQNACDFAAFSPSRGVMVAGDVTEAGVLFPGIADGWVCEANQSSEDPDQLWGECTRQNDDGSTSRCRDLGDPTRLTISLSAPE